MTPAFEVVLALIWPVMVPMMWRDLRGGKLQGIPPRPIGLMVAALAFAFAAVPTEVVSGLGSPPAMVVEIYVLGALLWLVVRFIKWGEGGRGVDVDHRVTLLLILYALWGWWTMDFIRSVLLAATGKTW